MLHQPTFAPRPSAPTPHADAELLRLDTLLTKAHSLREKFAVECDRTFDLFKPPTYGNTVLWQKSDAANVWSSPKVLDGVGSRADERFTYTSEGVLDELKARLKRWESPLGQRYVPDRDVARIKAIIAGVEAWKAEEDRQLEICGYKAADRAFNEQQDLVDDVARQIAAVPAHTAEGVCAKARAMLAVSLKSVDLVEQNRFADLLAKANLDVEEREELLTLSLMIDATRLDPGFSDPCASEAMQAAE